MPKCKNCGENITKFDKEICPFCGEKNPIDTTKEDTCDVTQTLNTINLNTKEQIHLKEHKKIINFVLCLFLGLFGADSFYLGFKKEGLIRILSTVLIYGGCFLLFYFLVFTKNLVLSLTVPFAVIYFIYIVLSIVILFKRSKDSNGVFLR